MAIVSLKVKHYPLSNSARAALLIAFILNLLVWIFVAYLYPAFPARISGAVLVIPSVFTLIFVLILLILRFRYTLFEKYPYLINLPSFVYRLGMAKDPMTEGKIISRVFTIHALSALYISALEVAIMYSILPINGVQHTHLLLQSLIIIIVVFVVTVFALYRNIYMDFAKSVKRGK